ncbi:hypothetical protein DZD18_12035 [Rhodobacteraceae bacterium W635]|uniref:sulfotransferase family 2 domain-containing protein n=1 Tax=Nioella halotolerans TaxID=2303578 RepID=UPI000E3E7F21|nr:hypothetical protein DZD18_12035 [Rhodobacteraceae bacterium W635]
MNTNDIFRRVVHFAPDIGLTYLSVPKVACSSFKRSIWESVDRKKGVQTLLEGMSPHRKDTSPFVHALPALKRRMDSFIDSRFVVVVRNPYVRLLSGYLDKVAAERRDMKVWTVVARQLDYKITDRPSFPDFVSRLSNVDVTNVDPLFAPQSEVANIGRFPVDHLGHLEALEPTVELLAKYDVDLSPYRPHETNSSGRLDECYTDREFDAAARMFANDFEMFAYSTDPADLDARGPKRVPSVSREKLREYLLDVLG